MPNNRQLQDGLATYQETISRAYNQSTPIPDAITDRWKPHSHKWLIHRDDFTDARITGIMKTIWKRTKASYFFERLNVPGSVILEVDDYMAQVHAWKKPGGNKNYSKSPGFIRWRKNKSTSTLICAIVHMVPFDTEIPWTMQCAEDRVLRDAVAMANGFEPCRLYPDKFEENQHDITHHVPPLPETDTQRISETGEVHTPPVETTTRLSIDGSDTTIVDLTSQEKSHGRQIETPPKSPTSEPDTTLGVSTDFKTRRNQLNEQIRNLLIPETAPLDPDSEMSLDEPEFSDPNMLVDYLRAVMQVQIAAAVRQVKRETYEQNVRNARAIELLMEERNKTLESVVLVLELENTEAKKIISDLQAVVLDNNKTISELRSVVSDNSETICDLQAAVEKSDVPTQRQVGVESSTQTPPQITDLTSEEMHAILYGVLANRKEEQDGTMVLL